MKLTYWKVQHQKDHDNYSIRVKTKKEAIKQLQKEDEGDYSNLDNYIDYDGNIEIIKYVIEYDDGFDLMSMYTEAEYSPEYEFEAKRYSYTESEIRKKFK
mgnify:CR=1 FL=1|tara:strand:- start:3016 stop:3315 length:300 start_codon:yes stop_codon:yes gene_type:complete